MKQEAFIDDSYSIRFSKTLEFFGEHELKQQQEIVKSIHKQFMKVLVQVVTS